jgi:hypothetical protein
VKKEWLPVVCALITLTFGSSHVAAQIATQLPGRQIELGKVLPFQLPEGYCLPTLRTAFPRVAAGGRWQDVLATAVAIAETLGSSGRHMVKVSITRDDTEGISLPDKYYRLAEVYLDLGGLTSLEVVKKPHTARGLRAYALRDELAAKAIDKGMDENKAYAWAKAEALKRLRLPDDAEMPPMRDYNYSSTIVRAELNVEIGAGARIALEMMRKRCP